MRTEHNYIGGLGLVAKQKRITVPGHLYTNFFPVTKHTDPMLATDGDVDDTVKFCQKIVRDTLDDTKKIAVTLKRTTLEATTQAIFDFYYRHYQYKEDEAGVEQLRRPARAWRDRKEGIDCDCFSISISSILTNLQIPHYLRIVKLHKRSYFQHIYVIVPRFVGASLDKRNNYIVIDPVLDHFNEEAEGITEKKDYTMGIPIQYLNGLGTTESDSLMGCSDFNGLGSSLNAPLKQQPQPHTALAVYQDFLARKKRHLLHTRNMIAKNPRLVARWYKPYVLIGMLDEALSAWDNELAREATLHRLSGIEHQAMQLPTINGKKKSGGFFAKLKNAGKHLKDGLKNGAKWVAANAKKLAKVILKYNPLLITARAGFRLAMKINFGHLSSKAYWGYFSQEQAQAKGVSPAYWKKAKELQGKIEHVFVKLLKGDAANLHKDIISGGRKKAAGGNLKGTEGLGVVAAATIASAMAFITPLMIMAKKVFGKGDDKSGEPSESKTEAGATSDEESSNPDAPADEGGTEDNSSGQEAGSEGEKEDKKDKKSKTILYAGLAVAALGVIYLATRNPNAPPQPAPYGPLPPIPVAPLPVPAPIATPIAGVKRRKKPAKKAVQTIKLT